MPSAAVGTELAGQDARPGGAWPLLTGVGLLGLTAVVSVLDAILPAWRLNSIPLHSTLEVAGASLGVVLAVFLLTSQPGGLSSRKLWLACGLGAMALLDLCHASVHPGSCFVWLHGLAVLAGGFFFAFTWLPETEYGPAAVLSISGSVGLGSLLAGLLSMLQAERLPAMLSEQGFTPASWALNLLGGALAALAAVRLFGDFFTDRRPESLAYGFPCLFFAAAGALFPMTTLWSAGWWSWHLFRLAAYATMFTLAIVVSRRAELLAKRLVREKSDQLERQNWVKTGLVRLDESLRGDPDPGTLASRALAALAAHLDVQMGALYVVRPGGEGGLTLRGGYAYAPGDRPTSFKPGEGLLGQAALERRQILLGNVPDDYVRVTSGLGDRVPRSICITPLVHDGRLEGVLEVGSLGSLGELEMEYLRQATHSLAIALESTENRERLGRTLEQAQRLAGELQAQQEELRCANEELEEQAELLKRSEERLRAQQEELEVTNEELREKNSLLEQQKREVEEARGELSTQAGELERASKYKSEFLANMSHELRTPLNSMLLLAQVFGENREGNLTPTQVEEARIIHDSGNALLSLINEILDLSRIEAGRMELRFDPVRVREVAAAMRASFQRLAADKGLSLDISVLAGAPESLVTDRKRLEQVLRNLLSNAVKFTERGGVSLSFGPAPASAELRRSGLDPAGSLAIAVSDTGIGIAPEQQTAVFEAFRQADGGISRKYGGTGLGLSISRELTRLLGGELQLESRLGQGSRFTLFLPVKAGPEGARAWAGARPELPAADAAPSLTGAEGRAAASNAVQVADDRDTLGEGDRAILIVEDDPCFAALLVGHCRERGFKALACSSGETGLELARVRRPTGIILDLKLPGVDGWCVLERLKDDPATRHIPVHIISVDEPSPSALRKGAIGHLGKPVTREQVDQVLAKLEAAASGRPRQVLVVEDDHETRRRIVELLADDQVTVRTASSAAEALEALRTSRYDCLILDLGLEDMDGRQLLRRAGQEEGVELPPVIVYTGRELTRDEEAELAGYSDSIIIKDVRSQERLLDEVALFLHRVVADLPESQRRVIAGLHGSDALLRGKSVMVVDDDMRTLFALSRQFADSGMTVMKAENGQKALELLAANPGVDLVLMDLMMPVLDGLEAIRRIRAQPQWGKLPIIALTAKAMQGDREQCLAAGASDYLSKPIDRDRLFSMMRVWLCR